jgi:hypothetical protein
MMKRKDLMLDGFTSNNMYVSVLKTPTATQVTWSPRPSPRLSTPKGIDVGTPRGSKRRDPQSKYLQALSACITMMVLWGSFRQVNTHLLPQLWRSIRFSRPDQNPLAQVNYNAYLGESDFVSTVGGRRLAGMHLLQVDSEEIPSPAQQVSSQPRPTDAQSFGGSLTPVLHRNLRSYEESQQTEETAFDRSLARTHKQTLEASASP